MQRTQIVIDKNLHNAPLGGGKGTSRADSTCATGLLVGKLKLGSQLCQIFSLAARDTSRLDQDLDPLLIEKVRCITCALTAPTSDERVPSRTHAPVATPSPSRPDGGLVLRFQPPLAATLSSSVHAWCGQRSSMWVSLAITSHIGSEPATSRSRAASRCSDVLPTVPSCSRLRIPGMWGWVVNW